MRYLATTPIAFIAGCVVLGTVLGLVGLTIMFFPWSVIVIAVLLAGSAASVWLG